MTPESMMNYLKLIIDTMGPIFIVMTMLPIAVALFRFFYKSMDEAFESIVESMVVPEKEKDKSKQHEDEVHYPAYEELFDDDATLEELIKGVK